MLIYAFIFKEFSSHKWIAAVDIAFSPTISNDLRRPDIAQYAVKWSKQVGDL